jgi:hypothetical protein
VVAAVVQVTPEALAQAVRAVAVMAAIPAHEQTARLTPAAAVAAVVVVTAQEERVVRE